MDYLQCIKDILTNHQQIVFANNRSGLFGVVSSVAQHAVFGPLLFFNIIRTCLTISPCIRLFVDDCVGYGAILVQQIVKPCSITWPKLMSGAITGR